MTQTYINTDVLHSAHVAEYLTKSDRRIRCGFRAALELLGLPLPDAAVRTPPGYKPGKVIAAAYGADAPVHGDRGYTASGNKRPTDKIGAIPTSRFAMQAQPSGIPRLETEQPARGIFSDVFGPN